MATSKRQRQKEGRQARRQAQQAAARRAALRRRIIAAVVVAGLFVALLSVFTRGGGGEDVTSQDTSSTSGTTASTEPVEPRLQVVHEIEQLGSPSGEPQETVKMTDVEIVEVPDPSITTESDFPYGSSECPPADTTERKTEFADAPAKCIEDGIDYRAVVKTEKGDFTIDLLESEAPGTVNNFVFLARWNFYDGVAFHRVIPGFVVQGGDAVGDPPGTGGPGYEIPDELPEKGEYELGSVAMANSGPDTNGSQFFVIVGQQGVALDPNYSLFGTLIDNG